MPPPEGCWGARKFLNEGTSETLYGCYCHRGIGMAQSVERGPGLHLPPRGWGPAEAGSSQQLYHHPHHPHPTEGLHWVYFQLWLFGLKTKMNSEI